LLVKENQAEHDVLVLGGVHAATQRIGHLPQFGLVSSIRGGVVFRSCHESKYLIEVQVCSATNWGDPFRNESWLADAFSGNLAEVSG